jgi:hypothetical protein
MAQQSTSIPSKNTGDDLTASEFNELNNAVNANSTDAETRLADLEAGGGEGGFISHLGIVDYNDTSTSSSPLALSADTWTTIPNNGLGSFSRNDLPTGVTSLLHTSTGALDITELTENSTLKIRPDFTVTPDSNNASLQFRFLLGTGANQYNLPTSFGRLDLGAGVPYQFGSLIHGIYAGDSNTIDNPIFLQVKLSSTGSLVNAGMYIEVYKK